MSCPRQHRPSKFKRLSAVVYPSTIQMPCFPSQQCSGTEGSKVVPHRKLRRRVQGVKRKNSPSHKIALAFDQNLHPFSWSLQPRSPTRKHLAQPIDIYCIMYELLDLKGKHKDECNFDWQNYKDLKALASPRWLPGPARFSSHHLRTHPASV